MKFSAITKEVLIGAVLACIVVVEAQYGSHYAPYTANKQYNNGGYSSYNYNHYSPCKGYHCNNNAGYLPSAYSPAPYSKQAAANRSPYGPYHSYAAKPAIYGGEKLYNYHGYTRHYPPPPLTYHPRKAGNGNYHPRPAHGMKPVKALALAPVYHHAPKPHYPVYSDYPNYPRAPARPYTADYSSSHETTDKYPRSPYNRQARPYRSYSSGASSNNNGYSGDYNNGAPRYANGHGNGHKSGSYNAYKTAY